jgi:hypothetical protein
MLTEFGGSEFGYQLRSAGRRTTALTPLPCRDPIFTPLFTSILTGVGFSAGVAAIGAPVLTAIATTALTIGLNALMAPKPPKPEDGKAPLMQSLPFRIYAVGETRLAGAYALWEAKGSNLYMVQALCGHRAFSLDRFYFHDDIVVPNPATGKVSLPGSGRYQKGGAWIYSRLGNVPEVPYDRLVAALSSDGVWTANHRGDGQATMAIVAQNPKQKDFTDTFPFGAPQGSVVGKWAIVWDYRIDSNPNNPAAWVWSKNCALIMCWHQCFNEFGHLRDYQKAILPLLDMWIEEADICDEDVPLSGGGTEKRYECGGWDTTENGPKTATNAILAACDGWICDRGDGALLFTVGKFRESRCGVILDDDVAGHNVHYDVLPEEDTNKLIPKFNYPDTDYSTADTDAFEDIDAQLEVGRVLATDMDLRWVQKWRQARRLGLREWKRIRAKLNGEINLRLAGVNAIYYRWNRVQAPVMLPRLDGMVVENSSSVLDLSKGGFTINVRKHPEDLESWTPAVDEGLQPPVPPKPNAAGVVTPVINLVQAKPNGSSVYIRVVIIDPEDESLTPTVRYRLVDGNGVGVPGAWVEQKNEDAVPAGGYIDLATSVVPSDRTLQVEVAFIASNGKYSNWSLTQTVTSTVDAVPPGTPLNFGASLSGMTVTVGATSANDNTRKLVFKRWPGGGSFASGVVIAEFIVGPRQPVSFNDSPGYGNWGYGAEARNVSNIPSAAQAGPVPIAILGPELITSGDMSVPAAWGLGAGWSIGGGVATHAAGTLSELYQSVSVVAGQSYELKFDVVSISGGTITPRLLGGTTVAGAAISTTGSKTIVLTAASGNNLIALLASAGAAVTIDNVSLRRVG